MLRMRLEIGVKKRNFKNMNQFSFLKISPSCHSHVNGNPEPAIKKTGFLLEFTPYPVTGQE
jgi:hypothetical protein